MIEGLFDLTGKVALVTGGAKGIGAMITEGLVEAGAKVYICSRSAAACEAFAAEMSRKGTCIAMPMDLSAVDNIESVATQLSEAEDHLDILINNSGVSWAAPIDEYPEKGWDKVMNINVKSVFFLTQKLLPLLKKAGTTEDPSRVVNISSIASVSSESISSYAYGPSKAAVTQLSRILAKDLVKSNILVNAIGPGFFPSNMTKHFDESLMKSYTPVGRIGRGSDIAGLVIYLCSKAGSFMTGNFIPLDGGQLIK